MSKLVARRLNMAGIRKAVAKGLESLWTIDGRGGLFMYVTSCKDDHVPVGDEVVAETPNGMVVFKPDTAVMELLRSVLAL